MSSSSSQLFPFGFCLFDIDGTLVPQGAQQPSERVRAALVALRERGAAVIVATARPPPLAKPLLGALDRQVDFLLCLNGAVGFKVAEPAQLSELDAAKWEAVAAPQAVSVDALDRLCPQLQAAIPDVHYMAMFACPPTAKVHEMSAMSVGMLPVMSAIFKRAPPVVAQLEASPMHELPHLAHGGRKVTMVNIHSNELQLEELIATAGPLAREVGLDVSAFGLPNMGQISCQGYGKETPVISLLEKLSPADGPPLGPEDCAAFGDGLNDVSMLRWAGLGVAMADVESPDVTAAADLVTSGVSEDGVALVVEQMLASDAQTLRQFVATVATTSKQ